MHWMRFSQSSLHFISLIKLLASAYTIRLWKEEKVLNLMDRALCETCDANEFVRGVNVGLLCVQEHPWDRPTVSHVVFMLGSETASLRTTKQPAFAASRSLFNTATSSKADPYFNVTNTWSKEDNDGTLADVFLPLYQSSRVCYNFLHQSAR